MTKKIRITKALAKKYPWDVQCGCPLYQEMTKAGFPVGRIYSGNQWVDKQGKKHRYSPGFYLSDYAKVLLTGEPFVTTVSDET